MEDLFWKTAQSTFLTFRFKIWIHQNIPPVFLLKKDVPHPAPVLFIFDFVLKTFRILPQNTWKQSISIVADNLAFVLDSVKSLERRWTYIKRSQNSVLKIVPKAPVPTNLSIQFCLICKPLYFDSEYR